MVHGLICMLGRPYSYSFRLKNLWKVYWEMKTLLSIILECKHGKVNKLHGSEYMKLHFLLKGCMICLWCVHKFPTEVGSGSYPASWLVGTGCFFSRVKGAWEWPCIPLSSTKFKSGNIAVSNMKFTYLTHVWCRFLRHIWKL